MKAGKMVRDYGKEGQKLDYIWAVLSNLISQEQRDIIGELWESKLGCAKQILTCRRVTFHSRTPQKS